MMASLSISVLSTSNMKTTLFSRTVMGQGYDQWRSRKRFERAFETGTRHQTLSRHRGKRRDALPPRMAPHFQIIQRRVLQHLFGFCGKVPAL